MNNPRLWYLIITDTIIKAEVPVKREKITLFTLEYMLVLFQYIMAIFFNSRPENTLVCLFFRKVFFLVYY